MKPLTRLENFLAKIAGDPDAKMDMKPKTRKEMYLDAIANGSGGGSGGSGSGTMKVTFDVSEDEMGTTVTADKTFAEVLTAVQDGRYVYAVENEFPDIYQLYSATEVDVAFSRISIHKGEKYTTVDQTLLTIDSKNVCDVLTSSYPVA